MWVFLEEEIQMMIDLNKRNSELEITNYIL